MTRDAAADVEHPKRFAGRRALVTGSSRGIGAAVALRLAAEGADVALTARTRDTHATLAGGLDATAARLAPFGGRVGVVVCDITDPDARATLVDQAAEALGGPIEVLVNNAAAAIYGPPSTFPLRRRHLTFEANVHAPLDLAQAALPAMVEAGEGWIVNVSSGAARTPEPGETRGSLGPDIGVYGASKAALDRITVALADEVQPHGVRVNGVRPVAAVLSEGADALVGDRLRPDQVESMEQMVEAVVALACAPADLTGEVHVSRALVERLGLDVRALDGGPLPTP
ncbi:MAG: SDR family oxidoreductase [Actinobacteria bacterium]|nr:SDR family oxidoreductase [Actinomycetota bacterium]